jgi:hypothetical protein
MVPFEFKEITKLDAAIQQVEAALNYFTLNAMRLRLHLQQRLKGACDGCRPQSF